jgi:hypothetical protein
MAHRPVCDQTKNTIYGVTISMSKTIATPTPLDSFMTRDPYHSIALQRSDEIFSRYGFESYENGVETLPVRRRDALYAQDDRTSRRGRHAPDRLYVRRGRLSIQAEIKAERGQRPNFAVDIDSYDAVLALGAALVFVDLGSGIVSACMAHEITVDTIRVPTQLPMFEQQWARLQREWPNAELKPVTPCGGSMHPYILVPKDVGLELDEFLELTLGLGDESGTALDDEPADGCDFHPDEQRLGFSEPFGP